MPPVRQSAKPTDVPATWPPSADTLLVRGSHLLQHPSLKPVLRLHSCRPPQFLVQQPLKCLSLELPHRCLPSLITANLFRSSDLARINRVRTVPSGIPITIPTSADVISSIALSTRGRRNSSGKLSISAAASPAPPRPTSAPPPTRPSPPTPSPPRSPSASRSPEPAAIAPADPAHTARPLSPQTPAPPAH